MLFFLLKQVIKRRGSLHENINPFLINYPGSGEVDFPKSFSPVRDVRGINNTDMLFQLAGIFLLEIYSNNKSAAVVQ